MDHDIKALAKIIDKLLLSKNPEVKESLRELLIISTLSDDMSELFGPFSSLVDTVSDLKVRIMELEYKLSTAAMDNNHGYRWNTHNQTYNGITQEWKTTTGVTTSSDNATSILKYNNIT